MKSSDLNIEINDIALTFRKWHRLPKELTEKLNASHFARACFRDSDSKKHLTPGQAAILDILDRLVGADPIGVRILRSRFIEGLSSLEVAHAVGLSRDQVNRRQRNALEEVRELFVELERRYSQDEARRLERRLPPQPYVSLIGMELPLAKALHKLRSCSYGACVLITGLGGIGKTALADATARAMIGWLGSGEIYWMRVPENLKRVSSLADVRNQLALCLQEQGHPDLGANPEDQPRTGGLIVVDDVETYAQFTIIEPILKEWQVSYNLLVTSRHQPRADFDWTVLHLDELDWESSWQLVSNYAASIGVDTHTVLTSQSGHQIYDVVGGNPLALRIATSLLRVFPLDHLLEIVTHSPSGSVEQLYRSIYMASWESLGFDARKLLNGMRLAAENGATISQIRAITAMEDEEISAAIELLVQHSLLEFRASGAERVYGLHRLTRAFLDSLDEI
ncbi:MAG: hypothetical protein EPO32_02690 [Anaerolineae bacterium]|nr:MAG: hypothetical protein EPO32_02690 [Anaerolineae bacterium]